jgi:hypothetical protein
MRLSIKDAIKDFDSKFPIGTEVIVARNQAGAVTRTWSHAGRIGKGKAQTIGVFVDGIEEPVAIASIEIEGWE